MSFLSILKKSESKYVYLLGILCLLHGLNGFIYSCIPFNFYDPVLICHDGNSSFACTQNTACGTYPYEIDENASFGSITKEFELICDNRFIKPTMQAVIFAGFTISGLTMSFLNVDPYKRMKLMVISYIIGALLALLASILENIWLLTVTLFLAYLFSFVWYTNIYTYASETFEPPLKKITPSLFTCSFGIGTMLFSTITLLVEKWRLLMAFYFAIPVLVGCIIWILYQRRHHFEPKNIEIDMDTSTGNKGEDKPHGFTVICRNATLRRNVLVYIFLWNMNSISYFGCDIALGSLSGRLAFIMFSLGFVQAICSIVSVNLLQKYIPLEFQQNVFALGESFTCILNLVIPYYIELMIYINLSPIFGFGILALIGRITINYLIKVETFEEKYERKKPGSMELISDKPIAVEQDGLAYRLIEESKTPDF